MLSSFAFVARVPGWSGPRRRVWAARTRDISVRPSCTRPTSASNAPCKRRASSVSVLSGPPCDVASSTLRAAAARASRERPRARRTNAILLACAARIASLPHRSLLARRPFSVSSVAAGFVGLSRPACVISVKSTSGSSRDRFRVASSASRLEASVSPESRNAPAAATSPLRLSAKTGASRECLQWRRDITTARPPVKDW
mmetsp:Transcript_25963/g.103815  ORF Transcript_25963/g.103815 Transcript_25963/m.103815 type:complete len:200 (-) Transcript_25963:98-697(-)